jgi:hypothetical protein
MVQYWRQSELEPCRVLSLSSTVMTCVYVDGACRMNSSVLQRDLNVTSYAFREGMTPGIFSIPRCS